METTVTHNGIRIELQMNDEPRRLRDGTWAHPVKITSKATLEDLQKLVGLELWGLPVTAYLPERGVQNQTLQTVGLVLSEKKWGCTCKS